MKTERLDSLMQLGVAYDLETHLSQPGLPAPPVVCAAIASASSGKIVGQLGDRAEGRGALKQILYSQALILIGANISFDVICEMVDHAKVGEDITTEVFRMYDPDEDAIHGIPNGRVIDVQTWEKLHAIAKGWLGLDPFTQRKVSDPETHKPTNYNLDVVVQQVLARTNAKANGRFRLSYAMLEDIPIEQWPPEARTYPIDDAVNTLEAALAQAGHLPNVGPHQWEGIQRPPWLACIHCGVEQGPKVQQECRSKHRRLNSHMLSRETYFSFCLALGAAWGYHINQAAVNELERKWHAEHDHLKGPFQQLGILRADGSCCEAVLKKMCAQAYGSKDACTGCLGSGKVPSPKTNGRTKINCKQCDGSGLMLLPNVPRSESGEIGISRDALTESGSPVLADFAAYGEHDKIPKVYIPYLRNKDKDGVLHPHVHRTLRPNNPLETDRVSYFGATMLLPRHGGVRECHEARPGMVYSSEDYKAGELVTHGQNCIEIVGASRLAEALNLGLDAHLALAAQILGIPYEEAVKRKKAGDFLVIDTRQVCKPPNFGFPGRMGAAKLTQQQRKQMDVHTPHADGPQWVIVDNKLVRGYKGLRFCLMMKMADRCGEVLVNEWKGRPVPMLCKKCIECAEQLKVQWLIQWPENKAYFKHVGEMADLAERGYPVEMPHSHFLRGFKRGQVDEDGNPINYGNAIANGYFQHRLAFAAGNAYMAATRECYDRTVRVRSYTKYTSKYEGCESPLFGSRLPQFQHDEIIGEHPESVAHEGATRIGELLEESLRMVCPDMADGKAIEAKPTLMRKMYKGAEPVWLRGGMKGPADAYDRLIPWEPKAT